MVWIAPVHQWKPFWASCLIADEKKAGGAYVTVTGRVRNISVPEKTLVMEDGAVIPLEDVDSVVF